MSILNPIDFMMDFENSSEDAPAQGINGVPLTLGEEDSGLISLLSPPSKDALRAFIQHGRTSKEEAASLFRLCHSSEFSWFDDEDNNSNNSNNTAVEGKPLKLLSPIGI